MVGGLKKKKIIKKTKRIFTRPIISGVAGGRRGEDRWGDEEVGQAENVAACCECLQEDQ